MKKILLAGLAVTALVAVVGVVALAAENSPATTPTTTEHPGVRRVGGDAEAHATFDHAKGAWRAGDSVIDTPLPVGYPAPTPPGALEIKEYPLVRRAEIAGTGDRSGSGFMPLFRHIQRHDIAMTSPVEMDYSPAGSTNRVTSNWTMSFLYRTRELRDAGTDDADARITVRDVDPMTVLSLGGRGSYANDRIERDIATLRQWLTEHPGWEAAGDPRALLYNGPNWRPWLNWLEVQIPIRPATPPAIGSPPAE